MAESAPITQHQPAIKVGGRRLSITTKHKPHHSEEKTSPEEEEEKKPESIDYPRPASHATGDAEAHHDHIHHQYEEEGPHKKEKKQTSDKKVQEYAHWKSETTRPTRDINVGQKGHNTRISQPAGKGVNV